MRRERGWAWVRQKVGINVFKTQLSLNCSHLLNSSFKLYVRMCESFICWTIQIFATLFSLSLSLGWHRRAPARTSHSGLGGASLSPRSFKFNLDEYSNWGWEARARPERGRVRPASASQLGRVYLGHSLKLDQWNLWNIQRLLHNTRPSQPHSLARVARGRGSLALCHRGWPLAPGGSGYASLCGYAGVCQYA